MSKSSIKSNDDRAHLRTGHTNTIQYVDSETGEPMGTHVNKTTYLANTKEQFFLMYSSMVLILKNSSDARMKLFASLLERYSGGQEFFLGLSLKTIISKEVGCSPRTLEKAFTTLVRDNVVVRIDSRMYKVNPRHVFFGSSKNRNKALKAILEICCNA